MTNGKHPVWDGSTTLDDNALNRRAKKIMASFYLGQGHSEPPEWEDLGEDFRFGFQQIVRDIDRGVLK